MIIVSMPDGAVDLVLYSVAILVFTLPLSRCENPQVRRSAGASLIRAISAGSPGSRPLNRTSAEIAISKGSQPFGNDTGFGNAHRGENGQSLFQVDL